MQLLFQLSFATSLETSPVVPIGSSYNTLYERVQSNNTTKSEDRKNDIIPLSVLRTDEPSGGACSRCLLDSRLASSKGSCGRREKILCIDTPLLRLDTLRVSFVSKSRSIFWIDAKNLLGAIFLWLYDTAGRPAVQFDPMRYRYKISYCRREKAKKGKMTKPTTNAQSNDDGQ